VNPKKSNLIEVSGLTKRFGPVTVLNDIGLNVQEGEIHALLGANGAGKSTLVRIIAGLLPQTSGSMRLAGTLYHPTTKQHAEDAGVQIVQQELNLIPTLTVAENLFLNRLPSRLGVIRRQALHSKARRALDLFGLEGIPTDAIVSSLGVGHQQMVEIATALDRDCKLLVLDEPTAALSAAESETLFEWLGRLRGQGVGIIYISHRLEEVAKLADRVSVLRDGALVGTYPTVDVTTQEMVRLMSGDSAVASHFESHESWSQDPVAMEVSGLSGGIVNDVSFTVHQGERLGIAGLVGSGRTELLRLIFGADRAEAGHVLIADDGTPRRFQHPSQAVHAGLAMITEDRKHNGLLISQPVRVNTTTPSLWNRFSKAGIVQRNDEKRAAMEMCDAMETRCTSIEQTVGTLSGGNQQKVAVAKWLVRDAAVFLVDEPTRGIDVAARHRIHRLIEKLANDGKGIVMVSSDLDELLETCDRIAVMSNGRLVDLFTRPDWSHDRIMHAAFSGYIAQESS